MVRCRHAPLLSSESPGSPQLCSDEILLVGPSSRLVPVFPSCALCWWGPPVQGDHQSRSPWTGGPPGLSRTTYSIRSSLEDPNDLLWLSTHQKEGASAGASWSFRTRSGRSLRTACCWGLIGCCLLLCCSRRRLPDPVFPV